MTIPSTPYKQRNQGKHLNVDRVGENEEAADGRNISMAAGSRFFTQALLLSLAGNREVL